jgi:hypothetical protein
VAAPRCLLHFEAGTATGPPSAQRLVRTLNAILIAFVAFAPACAHSRSQPADSRSDPYIISADELEKNVRQNLYDAVMELRPRWFTRTTRQNTGDPYVYLQDQQIGTSGALRRFQPSEVGEVRYLSPTEAQVQFGQRNHGRAAIVVVLSRDQR